MSLRVKFAGIVAVFILFAAAPSTNADFIVIGSPTAAYLNSTTRLAITQPDFTRVASLSDGTLTVTLSPAMEARTVPSTWGTWSAPPFSENATPHVLYSGLTGFSENLTFNRSVVTFGVEMQPNQLGLFPMSATFFDGGLIVGSISQEVSGFRGARLFAATTHNQPFTSVTLTTSTDSGGFAIAEPRYRLRQVPEIDLSQLGGALTLVLGGLAIYRRSAKKS
jgi:hypothetical protein